MPQAIELPNYDGTATWRSIPVLSPAAAFARAEMARVNGLIDVNGTVTITDASDSEFVSYTAYAGCWQFFDIPVNPANGVVIDAVFNPLRTTHTRSIVDEIGFSTVSLGWNLYIYCYVARPALGWQAPVPIDRLVDNNHRTHAVPPTAGRPFNRAQTGSWRLPGSTRFPSGLQVFIALLVNQFAVSNDVTLSSMVQCRGMLNGE
jgi:hypothetical protein